ncbi:PE-PGRS family protein [Streptomyces bambusae]|uniref:PE-PGRS family protein n=1 Tax=Streptomyces bambusae TaxID=1550616 RepID=A0ABS6Z106_9ACTN|nr:PE-PGRS family protein [Streptomyces bambusae]MBW5481059.1 PE-PGRS family protein [Streptomyces bambusae]
MTEALTEPVRNWRYMGFNRAVPDELLVRLLDVEPGFLFREDLSPAVLDAAVDHPDRNVRGMLVEGRCALTPEQRSRLLLNEPDSPRRQLFVEDAARAGARLTPDCRRALAADTSPFVRAAAAGLYGMEAPLLRTLAADPVPRVRAAACAPAWSHLAQAVRDGLLADSDGHVRTAALLRHHQDVPLGPADLATLDALDDKARPRALESCRLEATWAARLVGGDDVEVRRALAENPRLHPDALALLLVDEDEEVRETVAVRADLTEEQRAGVRLDIEPGAGRGYVLPWVADLHHDSGAMRRLAASSHPFIRSSVARASRLPADVVERLARDEDRTVRLFLAESCDDAPAGMLLEVWHWWDGSFSFPDRPRSHPNFPRAGLLRFATDPDPRLRRLALSDPESTPELVETLSRDDSAEVRRDVAEDPRLAPATAVRLLDDPDTSVGARAARNPAVPPDVLIRLLTDPVTARDASCNPALPSPVLRRMVELLEGEAERSKATP